MASRPPDSTDFGFLIYDVGRLMRSQFMEQLLSFGLTEAHWRAIGHLSRMEGCRQADLAQALQIRPITLARVIDKLEASGLVCRHQNSGDRRAVSLYLTEKSRPLLDTIDTIRERLQKKALQGINPGETEKLMAMLVNVQKNLSAEEN